MASSPESAGLPVSATSGVDTTPQQREFTRGLHSLARDLFKIAEPHLTAQQLRELADCAEEVRVQLDALTSLATLLAQSSELLDEASMSEAQFVLAGGLESAAGALAIVNDAQATLRALPRAQQ